jgi:hypothetical protein
MLKAVPTDCKADSSPHGADAGDPKLSRWIVDLREVRDSGVADAQGLLIRNATEELRVSWTENSTIDVGYLA